MEKLDIKRIIKGLMYGFRNVRYIAVNPTLTMSNIDVWENAWYFVAFEQKPCLKNVEGIYTWVADESIESSADEEGVFFLHFSSMNFEIDGEPLQRDRQNFMSITDLCFTLDDKGNVVNFKENIPEELLEIEKNGHRQA